MGSRESALVSKQTSLNTILTCHGLYTTHLYIYENTTTTLPFCICTLFYTVATHINYIGIYTQWYNAHRMYVYNTTQSETRKTIPCDFYFILAGGWQFVYIGGNFSNPVSVTTPDGGSPERPSSVSSLFSSLRFDKRLRSNVKCC